MSLYTCMYHGISLSVGMDAAEVFNHAYQAAKKT